MHEQIQEQISRAQLAAIAEDAEKYMNQHVQGKSRQGRERDAAISEVSRIWEPSRSEAQQAVDARDGGVLGVPSRVPSALQCNSPSISRLTSFAPLLPLPAAAAALAQTLDALTNSHLV